MVWLTGIVAKVSPSQLYTQTQSRYRHIAGLGEKNQEETERITRCGEMQTKTSVSDICPCLALIFCVSFRRQVSSATLDADAFKAFFETNHSDDRSKDTACIISVEGRQYPVDVFYTKRPVRDYITSAVETVQYIHKHQGPGDILLFLTGREEVDKTCSLLNQGDPNLSALPLYSSLPPNQQLRAFQPARGRTRKVVVATNVAETSVTIDGIRFVVDCGFAKLRSFDPRSSMGALQVRSVCVGSWVSFGVLLLRTCRFQCSAVSLHGTRWRPSPKPLRTSAVVALAVCGQGCAFAFTLRTPFTMY